MELSILSWRREIYSKERDPQRVTVKQYNRADTICIRVLREGRPPRKGNIGAKT